jgi:MerR family copper efflux transcriptional regulator
MDDLRIGQVAKATGVSVRAIRHYDQIGLLTSTRADNRYRVFQPEDVERVKLIQLFLSVGFRLDEVRRWAPCFRDRYATLDTSLQEAQALYARKIADVDAQLAALQRLRDKLATEARRMEEQARNGHLQLQR